MSARGPYRSHNPQFEVQLCTNIRSGKIGRREAQREYRISGNLVQFWLTQYDRGELDTEEAAAATVAEYEARIAALERLKDVANERLHGTPKYHPLNG